MQQRQHLHDDVREAKPVAGFEPLRPVTRYELAAILFQTIQNIEAAAAQPRRSPRELKPGRKSNLAPNPAKAKAFSDVPATHWARESIAGLNARGIALLTTKTFQGDKPVTGDELATWLDGLAGWVEGRTSQGKSVQALIDGGYIPQTAALLKKSGTVVTAKDTTAALVQVVVRAQERVTTTSPDSRFAR